MGFNNTAAQPVVKKVKVVKGKHHGGAWKVAFADFAIAMMAFFLLLWILSIANPEEKKAISGYFKEPENYLESETISVIVVDKDIASEEENLLDSSDFSYVKEEDIMSLAFELDRKKMEKLKDILENNIEQTMALKKYKDQIYLDITNEGLRIQIFDNNNREMFASGSAMMYPYVVGILKSLARPINRVTNRLSITGHTDANPFYGDKEMTNWELSTQRANAARRVLEEGGVHRSRMARIVGLGSTILFDKDNPGAALNRRISIIVLNKDVDKKLYEQEEALNKRLKVKIQMYQ